MKVTHKIPNMELTDRGRPYQIYAKQGDSNTRNIEICLYANNTPFQPPNGTNFVVRFLKQDGTSGMYDTMPDGSTPAVTVDGNVLVVTLAEQVLTCPGKVMCDVAMLSGLDVLGTFDFVIIVDKSPESGTDTSSQPYYKVTSLDALNATLDGKLDANQGIANAGKYLGIGSDGVIMPVLAPSGGAGGVTSVNGMNGNVTLPVPILGTCSTGASDATKVVAITGASSDTPVIVSGTVLRVKFSNANTASGIKLSVPGVPNQYPVIGSSMEGAVAPNTIGNRIHTFVFTSGAWVLLDPANASGTVNIDTTLSVSGKAADAKAAGDALAAKLNANQGAANAGKYLWIGSDGTVAPVAAPAGGGSGESDWRLIKDITVEADVKSVSVNSDYNGAGFSCREIYILSNAVNASGQTSATNLKLSINGQSHYDGNTTQYPSVTFGKTGESGRNWFWVKSINPLILFHGKWATTNSTQGNTVQCIQPHINDAAPNPFAVGGKIESIEISGGLSSSYIASGSRILIYGRG